MSKHNSKILKIYEQCDKVLSLKRNFVQSVQIPPIPITMKQRSSLKDYCSACYIKIAVVKFFQQASEIYNLYHSLEYNNKVSVQGNIKKSISKIKNTKELTSKHQQLQTQLDEMKKKWNNDTQPFVYYEINERNKLKEVFTEKFQAFRESQTGIKTAKNPHFVHQLISQLKQNLQQISTEDKLSDNIHQQTNQKVSKYLKDLSKEMEAGISDIYCHNFIFEQKKKLFSQFLQYHQTKNAKYKSNMIKHYFQELVLVSNDIKQHLKTLIKFIDDLIVFFKGFQKFLNEQTKRVDSNYQQFLEQVLKNKQICILLRVDIQERIHNNLKAIFSISEILKTLPEWFSDYRKYLVQCYSEASNYHERYITKQMKYRDTDSFEKILIEHKGFFSHLQKKQQKLNRMNIEALKKFVRDIHQLMRIIHQQNFRHSRFKNQVNVHETLNKIFAEYQFQETPQDMQLSFSRQGQDSRLQSKIKEYQTFITGIQIFDWNSVDWSRQNYTCSLGPKLLIHGYLQNLEQGLYYESSFNKKNYFFGKTRIFIPKKDIYQVNKQIALLIFPDVVEVKTNKGQIYFHALGKRDKMYESFINTYFPQVPESQDGLVGQLEFQFNQFKGEDTSSKKAYSIKPYSIDMGCASLKNADLRTIFRRYLSDDPFTYQGTQYQNFKVYQHILVDSINPETNQITPPAPYYFSKKGETIMSNEVPQYSVRLNKFQKKIPMIPFVSKGGNALCQEKSTYYWGSPQFFVVDVVSTMKGFKLTQGMDIKLLCIYSQNKQLNEVQCRLSADITFQTTGALNNTIKNQALNQLKMVMKKVNQAMQKNEKNRSVYKNKGNNLLQIDEEKQEYRDQIEKLKDINQKLNKKLYSLGIIFAVVYLLTIVFLQWESQDHVSIKSEN